MPTPACLRLQDNVFPRVRAQAARRLLDAGWSQTRIAAFLGVSQAMVSKYASRDDDPGPLAMRLADDLVQEALGPALETGPGPGPWCATLAAVVADPGMDGALQDLLEAEQRLRDDPPLGLVPQIGMNLARGLPDAHSPDQVLSYPGRLVAAGDRLIPPAPPALGASGHLAECLLHLRKHDPSLQALGSVRGGSVVDLVEASVVDMGPGGDRTQAFARITKNTSVRFVHDPGAFGIEPCLYIADHDATSVADTIIRLHKRLSP